MKEFRICPGCGYERGFHVYLMQHQEGETRLGLICPSCGASYDPDWVSKEIGTLPPQKGPGF